ncbi:heat shock protein [Candidatus Photodesmus blepharus]|uniref:Protein GrpE n=1 Tax=Candidatus Photodesmus blepharonis TaxID=1179155 RepID=A0A084CPH1_9GAMM|nr:nucleotide exchange factor GrpE [Candidatus Photodesmus blepharus]KEY91700.1 heat shock protein [Candidatus Photodesmus blepharus]
MSDEENKIKEDELEREEVSEEAVEGADVELSEKSKFDEQEARIVQLEEALLLSKTQLQDQQALVLRAKAEVENIRRRTESEIEKAHKYALSKFSEELLPVIDNLERAIQAANSEDEVARGILEGVELTHKTFIDVIARFGLKEINPEGEVFNPELHQAMSIQDSPDHESKTIMSVMQKGYELNGRVVRPAMVMVAK